MSDRGQREAEEETEAEILSKYLSRVVLKEEKPSSETVTDSQSLLRSLNRRFSCPRTRSITAGGFRVKQNMSFLEKNIRLAKKNQQVKLKLEKKKNQS